MLTLLKIRVMVSDFFWPEVAEEMLVQAWLILWESEGSGVCLRGRAGITTVKVRGWGREVFWIDLI